MSERSGLSLQGLFYHGLARSASPRYKRLTMSETRDERFLASNLGANAPLRANQPTLSHSYPCEQGLIGSTPTAARASWLEAAPTVKAQRGAPVVMTEALGIVVRDYARSRFSDSQPWTPIYGSLSRAGGAASLSTTDSAVS